MGEGSPDARVPCVRLAGCGELMGAGPTPGLLSEGHPDALISRAPPVVLAGSREVIWGVGWPCCGTRLAGYCCLPSPTMTCMEELALPSALPLLIRVGQEIAWVLGDKSGAWQGGSVPGCCLMNRFLLALAQHGGAAQGQAGLQRGAQVWRCWLCPLLSSLALPVGNSARLEGGWG